MDARRRELERRLASDPDNRELVRELQESKRRTGELPSPSSFFPSCLRCGWLEPPVIAFQAEFATDLPKAQRNPPPCLHCVDAWFDWRNEMLAQFLRSLDPDTERPGHNARTAFLIGLCWRCSKKTRPVLLTIDHPRYRSFFGRGPQVQPRVDYPICRSEYEVWMRISSLMFVDFLDGWPDR